MSEGLEALAAWTGKTKVMFVSDTDTDGWDKLKFINVLKKPSNAVIGITDKGDVFGGYVSVGINGSGTFPDKGQFVFSFFANGRCMVPQRWVMKKDRENAGRTFISGQRASTASARRPFLVWQRPGRIACRPSAHFVRWLDDDVLTGKRFLHARPPAGRLSHGNVRV